jgi:hypothetical protein
MVKTSDLVTDPGVEPPSWDNTITTNNATENILTEMNGEIVEAQPLGNSLILYSNSETWLMTADGSTEVYSYRALPFNAGAINSNCVVQVNNRHYVFGADDLWVHDGLTMQSIADGRVQEVGVQEHERQAGVSLLHQLQPGAQHHLLPLRQWGRLCQVQRLGVQPRSGLPPDLEDLGVR